MRSSETMLFDTHELLDSLRIPEEDAQKICIRPRDVVFGFIAQNRAAGQPLSRVYGDLAHVMSSRGYPDLTVAYFRRGLADNPDFHERLMHALMMAPSTTNEIMLTEAKSWAAIHEPPTMVAHRNFATDRDPDRPLRVGFTCSFFYGLGTRVAHLPAMKLHDRSNIFVIGYADSDVEDELQVADVWRKTAHLDDEAFAQQVLDDKVDILIEFNGRGGFNRFGAFARRCAPIQVNFGNFLATTGIPSVDYTVAAERSVPPSEDKFYTEKVARIKTFAIDFEECWPGDFFPEVSPPPYKKRGYITFGCFGASVKVHEEIIKHWCEIVRRVQGSKLYYKSMSMSDPGTMAAIRALFNKHGLTDDRLILEGGDDHRKMLELYGKVDIGLDTFPYNGGNTTIEKTWQGIPVVTYEGDRWTARTGATLLAAMGMDDLITHSWNEYVERAVALAADHDYLDRFRVESRKRMLASPLFDMPTYARDLERLYREMWHDWLKENPGGAGELAKPNDVATAATDSTVKEAWSFDQISSGNRMSGDFGVVLHIHVPKTAGNTVMRLFAQNGYQQLDLYPYTNDFFQWVDEGKFNQRYADKPSWRAHLLTGHFRLDHPIFRRIAVPHASVTILRDPIKIMLSHYNFALRIRDAAWHEDIASGRMDFLDYARNMLAAVGPQYRYFDDTGSGLPGPTGKATVQTCLDNLLKKVTFFGLSDRFPEFSVVVGYLFGMDNVLQVAPINRTEDYADITGKPLKTALTDAEASKLSDLLAVDIWFYDQARAEYERRVALPQIRQVLDLTAPLVAQGAAAASGFAALRDFKRPDKPLFRHRW